MSRKSAATLRGMRNDRRPAVTAVLPGDEDLFPRLESLVERDGPLRNTAPRRGPPSPPDRTACLREHGLFGLHRVRLDLEQLEVGHVAIGQPGANDDRGFVQVAQPLDLGLPPPSAAASIRRRSPRMTVGSIPPALPMYVCSRAGSMRRPFAVPCSCQRRAASFHAHLRVALRGEAGADRACRRIRTLGSRPARDRSGRRSPTASSRTSLPLSTVRPCTIALASAPAGK